MKSLIPTLLTATILLVCSIPWMLLLALFVTVFATHPWHVVWVCMYGLVVVVLAYLIVRGKV